MRHSHIPSKFPQNPKSYIRNPCTTCLLDLSILDLQFQDEPVFCLAKELLAVLKKDERGGPAQSTERHLQKFRADRAQWLWGDCFCCSWLGLGFRGTPYIFNPYTRNRKSESIPKIPKPQASRQRSFAGLDFRRCCCASRRW